MPRAYYIGIGASGDKLTTVCLLPRGTEEGDVLFHAAGRFHVARAHLLAGARPVLRHRVMLNFEAQAEGHDSDAVLAEVFTRQKETWGRDDA